MRDSSVLWLGVYFTLEGPFGELKSTSFAVELPLKCFTPANLFMWRFPNISSASSLRSGLRETGISE